MKCLQCKKEFESKRSTAKYCSDKCRKLAFQGISQSGEVSVPENGKAEVSVPEIEVSVPCTNDNTTDACKYLGANIHKDRDNIYSRHFDTSEQGFIRRNKAWLDASGFKGTPAEQEAARKINRQIIINSCIRINREHVANAISEAARRMKWEKVAEAMRKVEG